MKKALGIGAAVFAAALIIGCGGVVGEGGDPPPKPTLPSPTTSTKVTPKKAANPQIGGNDIVQVGKDVPSGTYRTGQPVGEGEVCVWVKSKDPEGAQFIDGGTPMGGRPAVTLKAGQWFQSTGCPDWKKEK